MGHRAAPGPHVADARYELLAPDGHEIYLARRHLDLTPEQWRNLPWHVQRSYRDGLRDDQKLLRRFATVLAGLQALLGIEEPFDPDDIPPANDDELRALGVTMTVV